MFLFHLVPLCHMVEMWILAFPKEGSKKWMLLNVNHQDLQVPRYKVEKRCRVESRTESVESSVMLSKKEIVDSDVSHMSTPHSCSCSFAAAIFAIVPQCNVENNRQGLTN